jgi:hypothetical protein
VSRYKVMVDDNFAYMDEDERFEHGSFETTAEAIAACRRLVDADLLKYYKPGMTATDLYEQYTSFGCDPFIVATDTTEEPVVFSAWQYAQERSKLLAPGS